ncbi:MAG: Fic family protein [Solirubrobacteraceae bacterium MAG38_C4-C5]|nr:Fic family protein [Candidatus Siliceabacter maunaloa]
MLFATPSPSKALATQLRELDRLRAQLGDATGVAGPWLGQLRRRVRASTMEGSVSIEGFHVPAGQASAIVAGTEVPDPEDADRMALACYARAMDHAGTMAIDPHFRWLDRVILDLHFDACDFQGDRSPGLWRTGPIHVTSPSGGEPAYTGPDGDDVPGLMSEVVEWLQNGDLDAHVVVRAAMAHLHLVSVHPFADGNGRISRITQSLVLAREGLLAPEFSSIEEYLGREARDYYRILQRVQGGRYQPGRDATPWVRFCITAHIQQARERLQQLARAAVRWAALEELTERRGWPDRMVIALEQSLFDGIERAAYASEADVSPATATTDLRRLMDAGLVEQRGRTRSTRYMASDQLRQHVANAVKDSRR